MAPQFDIISNDKVSLIFKQKGIQNFVEACEVVRRLPYGRNKDKNDLPGVFSDNCGTCGTKHALLKKLADENNFTGLRLVIGMFKMNGQNSPPVAGTLRHFDLAYIPEAHNYFKFKGHDYDFTMPGNKQLDYKDYLLEEVEIEAEQITEFKVAYHKQFLQKWLSENPGIKYTLSELWDIREQCIRDLSRGGG